MIFLPVGCLIFLIFILLFPVLFFLVFFHLITLGFEKLGLSSEATLLLLLLMLIGSTINIPLGRKKIVYTKEPSFFFFRSHRERVTGITINVGGAVIPILLSLYFLKDVPLQPVLIATLLMIVVSKYLSRIVPGRGIVIPAFIPPLFAAFFAFALAPDFMAPVAFISGVLGTLIGADILNLNKARKGSLGMMSIGGAGVFDGIFLVGIISALLS